MLINCALYQDGSKVKDISVEDISEYVGQPDSFIWVALLDASQEELTKMQEEFDLHELAVEDALHGQQRPKIEEYGPSLFAVMHLVEIIDTEINIGEVNVFVGSNYILSVRNRTHGGFMGVRARCEREPELLRLGSGFVFYALLDAVVDRYFPLLEKFELELEAIEGEIFNKGKARTNIEDLYELKGKLMELKHAVSPLMDNVGKLSSGRVHPICYSCQAYFRDVYDHLARIHHSIESMRETITTAIQVNLAMVSIEESEVNKRLAAWAGIFAAATAFAGVWGMNFKNMPELEWQYGYPMALSTIALTCGLLYYKFKKSGWL